MNNYLIINFEKKKVFGLTSTSFEMFSSLVLIPDKALNSVNKALPFY